MAEISFTHSEAVGILSKVVDHWKRMQELAEEGFLIGAKSNPRYSGMFWWRRKWTPQEMLENSLKHDYWIDRRYQQICERMLESLGNHEHHDAIVTYSEYDWKYFKPVL